MGRGWTKGFYRDGTDGRDGLEGRPWTSRERGGRESGGVKGATGGTVNRRERGREVHTSAGVGVVDLATGRVSSMGRLRLPVPFPVPDLCPTTPHRPNLPPHRSSRTRGGRPSDTSPYLRTNQGRSPEAQSRTSGTPPTRSDSGWTNRLPRVPFHGTMDGDTPDSGPTHTPVVLLSLL